MSYANGIITSPVEIADLEKATGFNGSAAGYKGSLHVIVTQDSGNHSSYASAFSSEGAIIPSGEPYWNIFSENSPADWNLNISDNYFLVSLKRASYLPSTIKFASSLEMFAGYDHNAPKLVFDVPGSVSVSQTFASLDITYSIPRHVFTRLFDEVTSNLALDAADCYFLLTGESDNILGSVSLFDMVQQYDSTIKSYKHVFEDVYFSGLSIYKEDTVLKDVMVRLYHKIGEDATLLSSYNLLCSVTPNSKYFFKTISFTGTEVKPYDPVPFTITVSSDVGYYSSAFYLRQAGNDEYIALHINDLVAYNDCSLELRLGDETDYHAFYYIIIPAGSYREYVSDLVPASKEFMEQYQNKFYCVMTQL